LDSIHENTRYWRIFLGEWEREKAQGSKMPGGEDTKKQRKKRLNFLVTTFI